MDNKHRALRFFELVMARKIDEAYATCVDMDGKHHNAYSGAGFAALKADTVKAHTANPHARMDVKHVLGDGDMVAVHSHVMLKPGDRGFAVVHVLRFANGKIVEMWDCGQAVPEELPNTDGLF